MTSSDTSDDDGVSTVDQYEARLAECEDALWAAREQLAAGDERSAGGGRATRPLATGGALAALGMGVGTAAVEPQGQVGTEDRSVETVHTAALAGPVTGGEELTSLVGDGLAVEDGALAVDGGN